MTLPSDSQSDTEEQSEVAEKKTTSESRESRNLAMRMAGLGMELASYTLAMAGLGFAIDHYRGHSKAYATALGTLIGFSYGMYQFILRARSRSG